MDELQLIIINEVNGFIDDLPENDQIKIKGKLTALRNRDFDSIYIRWLTKKLRELKVNFKPRKKLRHIINFISVCCIKFVIINL